MFPHKVDFPVSTWPTINKLMIGLESGIERSSFVNNSSYRSLVLSIGEIDFGSFGLGYFGFLQSIGLCYSG